MVRIQTLDWEYRPGDGVGFSKLDLFLLNSDERAALQAAEEVIRDRLTDAGLDDETRHGVVELSGAHPRVDFRGVDLDAVGPTEIDVPDATA